MDLLCYFYVLEIGKNFVTSGSPHQPVQEDAVAKCDNSGSPSGPLLFTRSGVSQRRFGSLN